MNLQSLKTFLGLFAAVVLLQACSQSQAENSASIPPAHAPIPVQVMSLEQQALSQPLKISGEFTTDDETTLSFKTGGIVSQVLVKEGEAVRKGQLLATLDLTEINAAVKQAELGVEKASRDFARAQNLYQDSVATLEQYQNARTLLSLAEQQLTAARFNLGFSQIRATADGYVLRKFVNEGQVVAPGASILRTNGAGKAAKWLFRAGISDKEWALLQVGDQAVIHTDAAAGKPIEAAVVRKSEGVDPQTGAFSLELAVAPQQQQQQALPLASGLFGTATVTPGKSARVWRIPHEALLDANANKGWVFVTTDYKKARKVPVTVASLDNHWVYISEGLEDAGALITRGSAYLTDNSLITVTK